VITREHFVQDRSVTWTWKATFFHRQIIVSWSGPVHAYHPDNPEYAIRRRGDS